MSFLKLNWLIRFFQNLLEKQIYKVDTNKNLSCSPVPIYPEHFTTMAGMVPAIENDEPNIIDIMIVASNQVITRLGSISSFITFAQSILDDCNAGLMASQCNPRFRLVFAGAWNYNESGDCNTDLYSAQANSELHAMRMKYGADLVQVIVENAGGPAGTGYLMTSLSTSFAGFAYNVVQRAYAVSNHSSLHEFLHNMGCAHDKADASVQGCFPYSYGYRNATYRDVESYGGQLRLDLLSNGGRFPYTDPNGNALIFGDSLSDLALTVNNTCQTVANFIKSVSTGPIPVSTLPLNGVIAPIDSVILGQHFVLTYTGFDPLIKISFTRQSDGKTWNWTGATFTTQKAPTPVANTGSISLLIEQVTLGSNYVMRINGLSPITFSITDMATPLGTLDTPTNVHLGVAMPIIWRNVLGSTVKIGFQRKSDLKTWNWIGTKFTTQESASYIQNDGLENVVFLQLQTDAEYRLFLIDGKNNKIWSDYFTVQP